MHDDEAHEMSVVDVIRELEPCVPFLRGVTVSGGECMLQPEWLTELFLAVKRLGQIRNHPLTCLVDSNGTIPFSHYPELMQVCDGVMLDVKAWDEAVYSRLTGAPSNQVVRENLGWLLGCDKLTEVRIVCLSGRVDVETILENIAETFDSIGRKAPVRLIRFRPQGVVGELSNHPMPSDEQMNNYARFAHELGLGVTIR